MKKEHKIQQYDNQYIKKMDGSTAEKKVGKLCNKNVYEHQLIQHKQ